MRSDKGTPHRRSFRDQFGREGKRETLPDPHPRTMRAAIEQWEMLAAVYSVGEKQEAERCRDRADQVRRRLERAQPDQRDRWR